MKQELDVETFSELLNSDKPAARIAANKLCRDAGISFVDGCRLLFGGNQQNDEALNKATAEMERLEALNDQLRSANEQLRSAKQEQPPLEEIPLGVCPNI